MIWDTSTIRAWLNKYFYESSFNDEEKNMIKDQEFKQEFYSTTEIISVDKVFLLSKEDMMNKKYGFSTNVSKTDIKRRCTATAYAKNMGVITSDRAISDYKKYRTKEKENTCSWYLRWRTTPYSENVSIVYYNGIILNGSVCNSYKNTKYVAIVDSNRLYVGENINNYMYGIRPAIIVRTNSIVK